LFLMRFSVEVRHILVNVEMTAVAATELKGLD
jgi:hypothetical protein